MGSRERSVLNDVTNHLGKRRASLVPVDSIIGKGSGYQRNLKAKVEEDEVFCKASQGVDNLAMGKDGASYAPVSCENVIDGHTKNLSLPNAEHLDRSPNVMVGDDADPVQEKLFLNVPVSPDEDTDLSDSLDDSLHLRGGHNLMDGILEGDETIDSSISSASLSGRWDKTWSSVPATDRDCLDENGNANTNIMSSAGMDTAKKTEVTYAHGGNAEGRRAAGHGHFLALSENNLHFVGSQESAVDCNTGFLQDTLNDSRQSGSLGSKMLDFGILNANTGFTAGGGCEVNEISDSNKACSCTFCLKAAYVWSELHYQDARGRLAEINRSMKQVRVLMEKSYIHGDSAKITGEASYRSAKLEVDLMHQWRSLFLHTEDALDSERTQIRSSLTRLKELRENCKKEAQIIKEER